MSDKPEFKIQNKLSEGYSYEVIIREGNQRTFTLNYYVEDDNFEPPLVEKIIEFPKGKTTFSKKDRRFLISIVRRICEAEVEESKLLLSEVFNDVIQDNWKKYNKMKSELLELDPLAQKALKERIIDEREFIPRQEVIDFLEKEVHRLKIIK